MHSRIQIYTDEKGNKRSIIVSYDEWEKLNDRVRRLENKLKIISGIRNGLAEVEQARRSGKKLQSLADFVNESRH
jgi:tetrahydromethanopterin S-methyltransferase subunit G